MTAIQTTANPMMTSSNGSIFLALVAICAGNSPVLGEFPAQRPVARSFDVSLICGWLYGWVNNREAGDFGQYRAHYDVTVMWLIVNHQNNRGLMFILHWGWFLVCSTFWSQWYGNLQYFLVLHYSKVTKYQSIKRSFWLLAFSHYETYHHIHHFEQEFWSLMTSICHKWVDEEIVIPTWWWAG